MERFLHGKNIEVWRGAEKIALIRHKLGAQVGHLIERHRSLQTLPCACFPISGTKNGSLNFITGSDAKPARLTPHVRKPPWGVFFARGLHFSPPIPTAGKCSLSRL